MKSEWTVTKHRTHKTLPQHSILFFKNYFNPRNPRNLFYFGIYLSEYHNYKSSQKLFNIFEISKAIKKLPSIGVGHHLDPTLYISGVRVPR